MKSNIRLLAVSRMDAGFCIAGIAEGTSAWVRPVRDAGQISRDDLIDSGGKVLAPLDLVSFDLGRYAPQTPHVEDFVTDFGSPLVIAERPSAKERQGLLEGLVEASPDDVIIHKQRSLVMIEPERITSASFDPKSYDGKYTVRLGFALSGKSYDGASSTPGYPCTDLRLRNWGRKFVTRRVLTGTDLLDELGIQRIFLVMGLSRPFNGTCWPMVVGFHTWPDFPGTLDFDNP